MSNNMFTAEEPEYLPDEENEELFEEGFCMKYLICCLRVRIFKNTFQQNYAAYFQKDLTNEISY